MKSTKKFFKTTILTVFMVCFMSSLSVSAGQVTIVGTVNGTCQIITDEAGVYEVAVTETGGELGHLVGARVTVTGTVHEIGGARVLTVTEYRVLEEYTGRRTNWKMKGNEQPGTAEWAN
jgi:hypothetical protein